jgi:fucose permease
MSGAHDLIAVTITSALAFGIVLPLLSNLQPALALRLGVEEGRLRGLLMALNLTLIPLVLLSGFVVDTIGVRWVVLGGSVITSLALFALGSSRSYRGLLAATLLAGVGGAALSTAAIVLMPDAFFDDNPAASENLGNVFFGLGALVTPVLADLLLRGLRFDRALAVLAVVCLVPAGLAIWVGDTALNPPHAGTLADVWSNPLLWLAALVFLFYGPLEGALATWGKTYLVELGQRERRAAFLVSGFWLTFLGARFLTALALQSELFGVNAEAWMILLLTLLAAIVLGNLAGMHGPTVGGLGLLLMGALLGPIFPTLVGMLFKVFNRGDASTPAEHGIAYGGMFAIGATGSLAISSLVNRAALRSSVRTAFRPLAVTALLLAGAVLLLGLSLSR